MTVVVALIVGVAVGVALARSRRHDDNDGPWLPPDRRRWRP